MILWAVDKKSNYYLFISAVAYCTVQLETQREDTTSDIIKPACVYTIQIIGKSLGLYSGHCVFCIVHFNICRLRKLVCVYTVQCTMKMKQIADKIPWVTHLHFEICHVWKPVCYKIHLGKIFWRPFWIISC